MRITPYGRQFICPDEIASDQSFLKSASFEHHPLWKFAVEEVEKQIGPMLAPVRLAEQFSRFVSFVHDADHSVGPISFRDSTGFLGREEDYKSSAAETARAELRFKDWKESWIGTGKIASCASRAISKASNLINVNQKIDFKHRLDPTHPDFRKDAERALYDLYCTDLQNEKDIFEKVCSVFGHKYDTISFLFFIKDDSRFLPMSPGNFDRSFSILGIKHTMSGRCSWENYQTFTRIIANIRDMMQEMLPVKGTLRLIDAHSFVWVVGEKRFIDWIPNVDIAAEIERVAEGITTGKGGKRQITSHAYIRSTEVVRVTKERAAGICQYCGASAPFVDKHGNPYLEVHHIVWLSRNGSDSTDNTVALCPNCHTRMHILDDPDDVKKLQNLIQQFE